MFIWKFEILKLYSSTRVSSFVDWSIDTNYMETLVWYIKAILYAILGHYSNKIKET